MPPNKLCVSQNSRVVHQFVYFNREEASIQLAMNLNDRLQISSNIGNEPIRRYEWELYGKRNIQQSLLLHATQKMSTCLPGIKSLLPTIVDVKVQPMHAAAIRLE